MSYRLAVVAENRRLGRREVFADYYETFPEYWHAVVAVEKEMEAQSGDEYNAIVKLIFNSGAELTAARAREGDLRPHLER